MDCIEFRSTYSDFADGLLDELHEVVAQRHMSECPPCRRFHETLQWGVSELRRQPRVLPSGDFAEKLERRLRAESSSFAPVLRHRSGAAATLMALTVAAAGMFAVEVAQGRPAVDAEPIESPPPRVPGWFRARPRFAANDLATQASWRFASASGDSFVVHRPAHAGQLTVSWTGR